MLQSDLSLRTMGSVASNAAQLLLYSAQHCLQADRAAEVETGVFLAPLLYLSCPAASVLCTKPCQLSRLLLR